MDRKVIRVKSEPTKIPSFIEFLKKISEGDILYNINPTSHWGEYLLVAAKSIFREKGYSTGFILLTGLKKDEDNFVPTTTRIYFSSSKSSYIPYLKKIGWCKFQLMPVIKEEKVNEKLTMIYKSIELKKIKDFSRKPKNRKYDEDGSLFVKN